MPNSGIGKRKLFPESILRKGVKAKEPTITFKATPKQTVFIQAVMTLKFKFMAIGGGIRGTKTICILATLVILCRMFPRSRWAIVRVDLPTLRRNVVPAMDKIILWSGGFVGDLNQSTWSYTCANGSVLLLFAEQLIQDPDLDRWKGLEVNGFALEEGNELAEKSANKAIERAGSYIIPATQEDPNPRQPPPFIFVTFNPCNEWPRTWFYEKWKSNTITEPYYFLPATILDNPYASEEYKASLKYLPPDEYKRFVEGEWDFIDDPRQLIKLEWVWKARNVEFIDGKTALGADVARYGDDWSSIYKVRGNSLWGYTNFKHFDTVEVGQALLNIAGDQHCPVEGTNVHVDAVGLGAGTIDYARHKGLPVQEVIAGGKVIKRPGGFFQFDSLRSQMWWEFREKLRLAKFRIALFNAKGEEQPLPPKLIGDLTNIKYEISGDKVISVEPKDGDSPKWGVKKRLGRSPDDGDALVSAAFDWPDLPKRPVLPGTVILSGGR